MLKKLRIDFGQALSFCDDVTLVCNSLHKGIKHCIYRYLPLPLPPPSLPAICRWHYTCIDLQAIIANGFSLPDSDDYQFNGVHFLDGFGFYADEDPQSRGFYLDEVSFSHSPRTLDTEVQHRTQCDVYPRAGSIVRIRAHLFATVRILPCPSAFCPWTNIHVHERKCYF